MYTKISNFVLQTFNARKCIKNVNATYIVIRQTRKFEMILIFFYSMLKSFHSSHNGNKIVRHNFKKISFFKR